MPLDGRPGELDQASAAVAVAEYSAVVSEPVELAEAPADDTERRCPPAGRRSRRPPTGPVNPPEVQEGRHPKSRLPEGTAVQLARLPGWAGRVRLAVARLPGLTPPPLALVSAGPLSGQGLSNVGGHSGSSATRGCRALVPPCGSSSVQSGLLRPLRNPTSPHPGGDPHTNLTDETTLCGTLVMPVKGTEYGR